jgi:hypothetical protein
MANRNPSAISRDPGYNPIMCRVIAWSALVLCCVAWEVGLFLRTTLTFPGGRLRLGAQCGCLYLVRIPPASPAGAYGNPGLDFTTINSTQRREFLATLGFLPRRGTQLSVHFHLGAGYSCIPNTFLSISIPLWLPILLLGLWLIWSQRRRNRTATGFDIISPAPPP